MAAIRRDQARRTRTGTFLLGVAAFTVDAAALLLGLVIAEVRLPQALAFAMLGAVLLRPSGLRRGRLTLRVSDDATAVIALASLALLVPVAWTAPSRLLLPAAIASWVAILGGRALLYKIVTMARRRGAVLDNALIVGAGQVGHDLAQILAQHREFGLRPIGFVDDDPASPPPPETPILGRMETLPQLIAEHDIRHVVLAFTHCPEAQMVSLVRRCATLPVELYTVPRFFELGLADPRASESLLGLPLMRLRSGGRARRDRRIKRAFDLLMAIPMFLLAAPLMAVIALAVKASSPGPVLFRQSRVGQFGREMEILKFRTMTVNDDSDVTWNVENDQRVTSVGRFLRPTHLDELPQLWNVLRGDMSIVGPRPERPVFVDQFSTEINGYGDRHRYPVGITGWAQVNGFWGDTSIEVRSRLDNEYIERWTLWNDVVILLRTLPTLLGGRA